MWLLVWAWARAGEEACRTDLSQDLNCNGLDVSEEQPLDAEGALCADALAVDPTVNRDSFFDYNSFECEQPVSEFDQDGDGFGAGTLTIGEPPTLVASLTCDNCPDDPNPDQLDTDCDKVGDVCDNCLDVENPDQADFDEDGDGDACDPCPTAPFPPGPDSDGDGIGDNCDNCDSVLSLNQDDRDNDNAGDVCDVCPLLSNPDQADADGDGYGDVCDNCPEVADPSRFDRDNDGKGDACDPCPDLPDESGPDLDDDGVPDVCDADIRIYGGGGCDHVGGGGALALWVGLLLRRRR
jgi:hypothetical protein